MANLTPTTSIAMGEGPAQLLAGENDPTPPALPLPSWMPTNLTPGRKMPEAVDIYAMLDAWAQAMYPRILQAYTQKGGWEVWAQTELAMGITTSYPAVTVTREERVYEGTRERADLVLRATGEVTHIIELKTLSGYQFLNYGKYAFVAGFIKDIDKVRDSDLKDGLAPASLHAVGLCCINAANDYAQTRISKSQYKPASTKKVVAGANTAKEPYLIRWSLDVEVLEAKVVDRQ